MTTKKQKFNPFVTWDKCTLGEKEHMTNRLLEVANASITNLEKRKGVLHR